MDTITLCFSDLITLIKFRELTSATYLEINHTRLIISCNCSEEEKEVALSMGAQLLGSSSSKVV
jgi:hypothetical protein